MKNCRFIFGFKKANAKSKRSRGYYDKVIISGKTMSIKTAINNHPLELWQKITSKEFKIGEPIYMRLLEKVKEIDKSLVDKHRAPYKAPFVKKVSMMHNYEVDFAVRHVLQNEKFDQLILRVCGKSKMYTSLNYLNRCETNSDIDSNKKEPNVIKIKRKGSIYRVEK